jgi:hypothetical protein
LRFSHGYRSLWAIRLEVVNDQAGAADEDAVYARPT